MITANTAEIKNRIVQEFQKWDDIFQLLEGDPSNVEGYITCDKWHRTDQIKIVNSDNRPRLKLSILILQPLRLLRRLFFCARSYFNLVYIARAPRNVVKINQCVVFDRMTSDTQTILAGFALGAFKNHTKLPAKIKLSNKNECSYLNGLIGMGDLLHCFSRSVAIFLRYIQRGLYPGFNSIYFGIVKSILVRRMLELYQPKEILVIGSLNHPEVRRLGIVSKKLNIKMTLVIRRTIHAWSIPNLAGISDASIGLPAEIYCKNSTAVDILRSRLTIVPVQLTPPLPQGTTRYSNTEKNIFIFLAYGYEKNVSLLNWLNQFGAAQFEYFRFYVKVHPLDSMKKYTKFSSANISVVDFDVFHSQRSSIDMIISSPSDVFSEYLDLEDRFFWSMLGLEHEIVENLALALSFGQPLYSEQELLNSLVDIGCSK